jgi:chromosome segregation ATPase
MAIAYYTYAWYVSQYVIYLEHPMARVGVYRTDVEKARRALLAKGKHPSIDLVRAELGNTGSRSTIHRYLKEIEAEEKASAGPKPSISDTLQDLVARLAEQLHQDADARIAEHREASDARVREHAEAAKVAHQEAGTLRDSLQRTEAALAAERAAHQDIATQLQKARVQLAQLEERLAGQEQRSREQEAHLRSLEDKHQHARDALDHFRTQAQEQRAREQRQHEQALQALQVELRQAADQVTAKNGELLRLNRDNGRLLEQATHQQQALTTAERELRKAREELESLRPLPAQVASLEQQTAKAIAGADALQSQLEHARSQLEQTRRELHDAEIDRERTQARLEGMQAAWAQRDTTSTPAPGPVELSGKRHVRTPDAGEATKEVPLK